MSKSAWVARFVFGLGALAVVIAPGPALAAEPTPAAPPVAQPAPVTGLQCHDKALTGSGPGFSSSQEQSAEAAKKDWLAKALAIYSDADWTTAKDPKMGCVKQGLYSKCFATAAPCHAPPSTPTEPPKSN
jgi:hypothetical protein